MKLIQIGRRIYYLLKDGKVIFDTGEYSGYDKDAMKDILEDEELKKYNPEYIGYIELDYGEYREEFKKCTNFKVNIETLEIEFSFSMENLEATNSIEHRINLIEKYILEQEGVI